MARCIKVGGGHWGYVTVYKCRGGGTGAMALVAGARAGDIAREAMMRCMKVESIG